MNEVVIGDDGLGRPPWAATDAVLRDYYDTEWGVPVRDERGLFERLSLEAFQSGLSWATILRKRPAFRLAFANFEPDVVATFTEADVVRLLTDAGIIRNRAKIRATIANAKAVIALRDDGGLVNLIWGFVPDVSPVPQPDAAAVTQSPESAQLSLQLKKRGFSFVGPTTMYALMEAIGMVDAHPVGSHRRGISGVHVRSLD